jgi:hypothetical protein
LLCVAPMLLLCVAPMLLLCVAPMLLLCVAPMLLHVVAWLRKCMRVYISFTGAALKAALIVYMLLLLCSTGGRGGRHWLHTCWVEACSMIACRHTVIGLVCLYRCCCGRCFW